jgi:hypothetical protein
VADPALPRLALTADCSRCVGLCCVLPGFTASAEFALTKPAGRACPNLADDFRCRIHRSLRGDGFSGCSVYDCFGAGQHLVSAVDEAERWLGDPALRERFGERFPALRQLHELLWYVDRAVSYLPEGALRDELTRALDQTETLARTAAHDALVDDVEAHRAALDVLLVEASDDLRKAYGRNRRDLRGADLVGADLAGADLRGASLRGALLVGAQLQGADLDGTDLTGADLRGAMLHGADLSAALFVHPWQVTSARGDALTRLPEGFARPTHWA